MLDKLHGRRLWALLFALLCLAAFLRLYDLTADPPNHFASLGQALLTDPYHITVHARNKALFGEWEPFGYERWVAFKVSLVSALAYLMFSLSEVSRYTANLTSVILNLLASSLIVLGLLRSRVQTECQPASSAPLSALIAGTLLALSHPLIVYSRTPFLENGLLALSAATFYVSIAHRRSLRGAALAGVLAVLCPLAGKLFGALIVFPAALAIALSGQGAARRLAVFAGSAALTVFLWYVFVLGDQAGEYHAYLQEQSFGLYGAPPGLTSIKTFVMLLVTYGAEFRLFYFEVAIPLLLLLAALWLFVRFRPEVWKRDLGFWRERPALTFLVVWAVVAWLGLMVFHYRPLRYSLFVLVPLIGIIGALLGDALSARVQDEKRLKSRLRSKKRALVSSAAVTLIIWIAVVQGIIAFTPDSQIRPSAVSNVWISLLVSVVAGILLWVGWRAMSRFVHGDSFRHIVAIALALGLITQVYWQYRLLHNRTHNAQIVSRDLADLIEGEAVFTGPYAPTLTIDNHHRVVIYSFGLATDDADLFQRFPISHVAVNISDADVASQKFTELADNREINRWVLRNNMVKVLQLARDHESRAPGIRELIDAKLAKRDHAKALKIAREFLEAHPANRSGRNYMLQTLLASSLYGEALHIARSMVERDDTDFNAHLALARLCFSLNADGSRADLEAEGEKSLARAIELNPSARNVIEQSAHTAF